MKPKWELRLTYVLLWHLRSIRYVACQFEAYTSSRDSVMRFLDHACFQIWYCALLCAIRKWNKPNWGKTNIFTFYIEEYSTYCNLTYWTSASSINCRKIVVIENILFSYAFAVITICMLFWTYAIAYALFVL